ncbi:uncharacterized protein LODBEIA_P33670 [Lodderomyces beijingensis]|uniref:Zn(2)-C6 fungal-type domain-containing protein n=1 Tax=Lodderomyces beijingensis TaxID=1775926 RepID=A0ABP0ZLW5_9ASCO
MAKKKLNSSIKRSRTRSGCVTCRDRHIKCDEQQPICKNCIRSNRHCFRGVRLNFTQYTFYNPEENEASCSSSSSSTSTSTSTSSSASTPKRQNYRILDQSITIASLYNHLNRYSPYLHLHKAEDLRESDLQFQDDTYNAYSSTPPKSTSILTTTSAIAGRAGTTSTSATSATTTGTGTNSEQLMRMHSHPASGAAVSKNVGTQFLSHLPSSTSGFATTPTVDAIGSISYPVHQQLPNAADFPPSSMQETSAVAAANAASHGYPRYQPVPVSLPSYPRQLVETMTREKVFWLLDLTSDSNIWSTQISTMCLNETDQFYLDCLLASSSYVNPDYITLGNSQFQKWTEVENAPLASSSIASVEKLLVSVCLILHSIYSKIPRSRLGEYHKTIINNQFGLFGRLVNKIYSSIYNNKNNSSTLVTSLQNITYLRFYINKLYDLSYLATKRTLEVSTDNILASTPSQEPDLENALKMTQFEIEMINTGYQAVDPEATAAAAVIPQPSSHSETRKLKELYWCIIKADYLTNHPAESGKFTSNFSYTFENIPSPDSQVPLFDNALVARKFLQAFTFKLLYINDLEVIRRSNREILDLFALINGSLLASSAKSQWTRSFEWTLRYVNPPEIG